MARGKQNKPVAKTKTKVKGKVKAKVKAKAVARAKTASRAKASAHAQDADHEPSDTELMLQTLGCPTATADRLAEVCEATVQRMKEDLTGIAAAELVWRKRPEREAVAVAVQGLASELERHAEVMLALYDQFRQIAENDADHSDLEIEDVVDRLRPLLNSLSPD